VNRPSVEALRPDHCGGIHTTHDLAGQSKKGSVGRGGTTREIAEGEPEELSENTTSLEQRRRRVTFVLDFRRVGSRRLSLKASWSSLGVASGKSIGSR
jgi:hypothetical protein